MTLLALLISYHLFKAKILSCILSFLLIFTVTQDPEQIQLIMSKTQCFMDKLWKGGQCYQLYSDLYISFYMSEYYGL